MLRKKELEDYFENLSNILIDLNISINNAERLTKDIHAHENKIKMHGFFQHHYYQLRFIMIVQLAKILSNNKNQKINIHKLLNRLENEKYGEELLLKLNENSNRLGRVFKSKREVLEYTNKIRNELANNEYTILKIQEARDKVYAHYDPNKKPRKVMLTEFRELIDFSSMIFNILRGGFFDTNIEFNYTGDWKIEFVLKETSNSREVRLKRK